MGMSAEGMPQVLAACLGHTKNLAASQFHCSENICKTSTFVCAVIVIVKPRVSLKAVEVVVLCRATSIAMLILILSVQVFKLVRTARRNTCLSHGVLKLHGRPLSVFTSINPTIRPAFYL